MAAPSLPGFPLRLRQQVSSPNPTRAAFLSGAADPLTSGSSLFSAKRHGLPQDREWRGRGGLPARRLPRGDLLAPPRQASLPMQVRLQKLVRPHRRPPPLPEVPQTLEGFFAGDGVESYGGFICPERPVLLVDPSFSFLTKLPEIKKIVLLDSCNGLVLFGHRRVSDKNDYNAEKWVLRDNVSFSQLFGRMSGRFHLDWNVVAIHPDRSLVIFAEYWNCKLISYDMDKKEVHSL
ncbi:unnamed protein product [Miscanthus lutarioriparius]|uniref:Uncharacterized protein n=1 Tax=Miscanthus lutarioriparius TaxID=422564 RepID=A0A811NJN3_9POAL|nr:unnamed protein product [Miscanthus lutarioriparius]